MHDESPRTMSTAIPAIPLPSPVPQVAADEHEARQRIAALDREAKALGSSAAAAVLFHEAGRLWERALKHPRNAAIAYQSAFKLAPRFVANIRAARRLFADVGNWAMVVQLIDAELLAVEGARAKAALLFEKANTLETRLSREADALTTLQACLALAPTDVTLLVQLEQTFAERHDYASLVKTYALLAQALDDEQGKAQALTAAGLLSEDRLKQPQEAAAYFRQAFSIDRKDPQLLAAVKRMAQREGTLDEELAALAAEAESQGSHAAPTFLQIAKAYERLARPEDALAALLAARRANPNDPIILAELARLYDERGRHEELAEVLAVWATGSRDEAEFVSLHLRLAALHEDVLKRDGEAERRYRAVLGRVPGHAAALAGLGKLFYRSQNWVGLLETFDAEAQAADDERTRAAKLFRAGELLEQKMGRVEEAIARYQDSLKATPGYLPAQKALQRLFERANRWSDLVAMYEADLLQTQDKEQQISALNRMALLYEDRLSEVPQAISCLKRITDLSPENLPALRNLARLYERTNQWNEVLAVNEAEGRLTSDTKHTLSLAHRNAEILEEHLKDRGGAMTAWEKVLQLSPNYLPALRALGRLYGQEGRWDSLAAMYRAESEIAGSPEHAAALIQKVGELYEHRLSNVGQAVAHYREVLMLSPNNPAALRALGRMYRSQSDWEALIEILRAEAASRTDPTERANAIVQAAAIWEDQLKKPEQAMEGYQEVLRLAPGHAVAAQQLERLLTAKDDTKELVVLLDRQLQSGPSQARASAAVRLARLYVDRLGEPQRAAACLEQALTFEPENTQALRLLERIRANDKPRRAELRKRLAALTSDAKLAAALRLSAMDLGAAGVDLQQLETTYASDPSDETLGVQLEKALLKADDAQGLADFYERSRVTVTDANDLLQLSLRVGELCETRLNNPTRALGAYEQALQSSPDLQPALAGVARCARRLGDLPKARASLLALATNARDEGTRQSARIDAARFARDVEHDPDGAIAHLRTVLAAEPLHPEAGPMLEELLAKKGGAGDLAAMHQSRGDAKLAQRDAVNAAREFYSAARLYLDGAKNRDKAMEAVDQALMAMPTLPDALELKASLAIDSQNYADAAAALAVRLQQGGEPKTLAAVNLKLGALYCDQLSDSTRAASHLQAALAGAPGSVEALERLAGIHTQSKNWTGAADCLRRLLALDIPLPERAKHFSALARITDEGFGDAAGAVTLYRSALELTPGDGPTLDRLVTLYERTGQGAELASVLAQQAQQASDVKKALALKLRIATLLSKGTDTAAAIAAYRAVIDIDPKSITAYEGLAELYGRESTGIAMAIEAHRALLRLDPSRLDSVHALFRLWESLRQVDKAYCAAALLTVFRATNDVETAFFSEAKGRVVGEPKGLLALPDLETVHHPDARTVWVDVLRTIGDQFAKIVPPQLEQLGVTKADRQKSDSAVSKALLSVTQLFGVEEYEVYLAKRGQVWLETTEPLSVCVSNDVIRNFTTREQRFLFGRAALLLADKAAVVRRLTAIELADTLGNSVRIHQPEFNKLGRKNDEQTKQLRRAFSRKSLKALEEPAQAVGGAATLDASSFANGLETSADRAGLLACGDIVSGFSVLLKDVGESSEAIRETLRTRAEIRELVLFTVSDDFFRLRQRLGQSLG